MDEVLRGDLRRLMREANGVGAAGVAGSPKLAALVQDALSHDLGRYDRLAAFQLGYVYGCTDAGTLIADTQLDAALGPGLRRRLARQDHLGTDDYAETVRTRLDECMHDDTDDHVAAHNFGQLLGAGWRWLNHYAPAPEVVVDVLTAFSDVIRPPGATSIDMRDRGVQVVDSSGSGKKRVHLPSVTTAATVLAGHLATRHDLPLLISKSVSGGTSYPAGSADSAQLLGAQVVDGYIDDHQLQVHLCFVRCEQASPRFAHRYHGMTYAPTIVSVAAPALVASPVRRDAAVYGLVQGPLLAAAAHAHRALGGADVLVLSGRDAQGRPFIDEPSVHGATEWVTATKNGIDAGHWPGEDVTDPFPPVPPTVLDVLMGACPEPLIRMTTRQAAIILGVGMAEVDPWDRWQAAARGIVGSGELADYVARLASQRTVATERVR